MTTMKVLRTVAFVAFTALVYAQAPAKRLLKLDDMHRFHTVGDPQISPDESGWRTHSALSTPSGQERHRYLDDELGRDAALRLTSSPDAKARRDGVRRTLSLVHVEPAREGQGQPDLAADRNGGEAQQFTDFKGRLGGYEWSRFEEDTADPQRPRSEQPGRRRDGRRPAVARQRPRPSRSSSTATSSSRRAGLPHAAGGAHLPVGRRHQKARNADGVHAGSGSALILAGREVDRVHGAVGKDADRYNTSNVFVMEARSGATPKQLTSYDGLSASASRGRPEWSPDGKMLTYLQSTGAKAGRVQHEPDGRDFD